MKYLIASLALLFLVIAFTPTAAPPPMVLRATTMPVATAIPGPTAAPAPDATPLPDAYPGPAYPAPKKERSPGSKPSPRTPGLHCGRC